jgi:hypothetical protein
MAATATRRRLTDEERAARVEAVTAELATAVAALTDSTGWRSMLEVSARFRRYSLTNQLLLGAQATQRGMDPHPGRRVRQVAEAGLSGAGGGEGAADLRAGDTPAAGRRGGQLAGPEAGPVRPS